jgi:uncharacterized YccA/Bax inhibitor family protein
MPNPMLNDKAFDGAVQREIATASGGAGTLAPPSGGSAPTTVWNPPITDGPVSRWVNGAMTVSGTLSATLVLFGLLLVAATVGWSMVGTSTDALGNEIVEFPTWTIIGILVGFGCVIAASFKPHLAKFLAPVYAIAQGVVLGAISKAYNTWYDGIVVAAIGATAGVFLVMLVLYRTRILKVTDRMRRIVIGATLGIAVFYGITLLMSLFGANVTFLSSSSPLSIAFSFFVAGLAAFNLALDFDFIEKGAKQGAPKEMEWFAALGLLVTLVWLYLEILRLLSKLRSN